MDLQITAFPPRPAFITEENISQGTSLQKVFEKYITFSCNYS